MPRHGRRVISKGKTGLMRHGEAAALQRQDGAIPWRASYRPDRDTSWERARHPERSVEAKKRRGAAPGFQLGSHYLLPVFASYGGLPVHIPSQLGNNISCCCRNNRADTTSWLPPRSIHYCQLRFIVICVVTAIDLKKTAQLLLSIK